MLYGDMQFSSVQHLDTTSVGHVTQVLLRMASVLASVCNLVRTALASEYVARTHAPDRLYTL